MVIIWGTEPVSKYIILKGLIVFLQHKYIFLMIFRPICIVFFYPCWTPLNLYLPAFWLEHALGMHFAGFISDRPVGGIIFCIFARQIESHKTCVALA